MYITERDNKPKRESPDEKEKNINFNRKSDLAAP